MTETQATSGSAATSTSPTDGEAAEGAEGAGNGSAAGRAVVGRASVPGETPAPKYTRAPGMPPPPEAPTEQKQDGDAGAESNKTAAMPDFGGATATIGTAPGGIGSPQVSTGRASVPSSIRGSAKPAAPTVPNGRAAPNDAAAGRTGGSAAAAGTGAAAARGAGIAGGRVAEAVRAARATVSSAAARGPRRARLFVKRIDPWSVMKFSFAVAFVLFFVAIVATAVLYLALDAMGVWDSVNKALADMIGNGGKSGFKITAGAVIGAAGVLGLVNVVLFTALATLSAFIYNVCADLVGGIEVTLSEKD
ncbi:hypothetical protein GCM10023322_40950 [Rugosimonospora acidiphila]|uniref:DUF3566 domain-containing protein n=1 Tax=Rugosimonospora acidiphila TaxID=556531 RepID=A0ABP9S0G5_9ACTN